MDVSRLTPRQIDMQMKKERYQKRKEDKTTNQQHLRDRQQTQNGTSYRGLHDLINSDLCKTVKTTLQNKDKKEYIQTRLQKTMNDMSQKHLDKFKKSV